MKYSIPKKVRLLQELSVNGLKIEPGTIVNIVKLKNGIKVISLTDDETTVKTLKYEEI